MRFVRLLVSLILVSIISGCAHPIKVTPDITMINNQPNGFKRMPANVGYFISPEQSSLQVTTPGGGGDNVRYYPYRDMESGYERVLSNVFSGVVKLTSMPNYTSMNQQGLDYVIQPQLVTNSGSTGFFTWPPTNFTVDLTNSIRDSSGQVIATPRVVGIGTAETGERMFEHGIAGRRAMEDALSKMQAALQEIDFEPQMSTTSSKNIQNESSSVASRLSKLEELKSQGLITQGEFNAKRKEILDAL